MSGIPEDILSDRSIAGEYASRQHGCCASRLPDEINQSASDDDESQYEQNEAHRPGNHVRIVDEIKEVLFTTGHDLPKHAAMDNSVVGQNMTPCQISASHQSSAAGCHPSHTTRSSDASSFDEVCTKCGATDIAGGGWGKLAEPCPSSQTHVVGDNPMRFFSENVDKWGAAEWFNRLANAIREQDEAVIAKDEISFETYRMIAASSVMTLVREHEATVRDALATEGQE